MKNKKIYLISPREPSGATWLINCFLELGIMTYRFSRDNMWIVNSGRYMLHHREDKLKNWLPALSNHESFKFRKGIEIEWSHSWPTSKFDGYQIIYFVRDPRDAIFSKYKRDNPNLSFSEFIEFLDVETLLNKIDHWCFFNRSWLFHKQMRVFRFEDYKKDAEGLLRDILSYIKVACPLDSIDLAVVNSTFEKAREAEKNYKTVTKGENVVINRSSEVGSWKNTPDAREIIHKVEYLSADLLSKFGYVSQYAGKGHKIINNIPTQRVLSFLKDVKYNTQFVDEIDVGPAEYYSNILLFINLLSDELMMKAKLTMEGRRTLLLSLGEFLHNSRLQTHDRTISLWSHNWDKGDYFLNLFKKTRSISCLKRLSLGYLMHKVLCKLKRQI